MMKKLILFILIVFTISCAKEDLKDGSLEDVKDSSLEGVKDNSLEVEDVKNSSLEGEWILTKVDCYCPFLEDYDFSTNSIRFNTQQNKITIENQDDFYFLRESGTYNYAKEGDRISFDNNKSYIFRIESAILYLSFIDEPSITDDEVSYTYRKN